MNTTFERYMQELGDAVELHDDAKSAARVARSIVASAIADSDFRKDLTNMGLLALDHGTLRRPIHVQEGRRWPFVTQMFYWPTGRDSGVHTHRSWTVTAIVLGKMQVKTYESEVDRRLIKDITASAGEVGFIDPPCTHSVSNPGQTPAISLHVFTPDPDFTGENTRAPLVRLSAVKGLLELGESAGAFRRGEELERICAEGSPEMRLVAVKILAETDSTHATNKLREILPSLPPRMRDRAIEILRIAG